ncbi:hypothetical protein ACFLRF_02815 [Candidatus Altiarchaeota archaeon]
MMIRTNKGWVKSFAGFMGLLAIVLLVIALSLLSYSNEGYLLTKYAGEPYKEFTLCIEGEVNPSQQRFTLNDTRDGKPTVNPFVMVNGKNYAYNKTITDEEMIQPLQDLTVGCNKIRFGSAGDTQFDLQIRYKQHYRPVIKNLDVRGLKAGEKTIFFIIVDESWTYIKEFQSRLKITDITSRYKQPVVYDERFDGLKTETELGMGNYLVEAQIFDKTVWSDTYETPLYVTVVRTNEHMALRKADVMEDDSPGQWDEWIPVVIREADSSEMRKGKRMWNGFYVLGWRVMNYLDGQHEHYKQEYFG